MNESMIIMALQLSLVGMIYGISSIISIPVAERLSTLQRPQLKMARWDRNDSTGR